MTARSPRYGKSRYKILNWRDYDASLIKRGEMTFWFSEDAIDNWHPVENADIRKSGGQRQYSDIAIQVCLTMRLIYNLPLRQTEGFMNSIFTILGVDISSPDHTTMSRRSADLKIIRQSLKKDGPIDILIDSTGLKVCGSGEWEEAKHGKGRRKKWMKLHLGVNEQSQEIEAFTLTSHLLSDGSQVAPLLDQIETKITSVKADGAFDEDHIRLQLEDKDIKGVFPPRLGAVLSENAHTTPTQRDKDIIRIQKDGREIWEYASGYSKRCMVENAMFRYKNNIGAKLRSKTSERQEAEVALGIHLINLMTRLAMPQSVRII